MSEDVSSEFSGNDHVSPPKPGHSHSGRPEWHNIRLGPHNRPQRTASELHVSCDQNIAIAGGFLFCFLFFVVFNKSFILQTSLM